MPPSFIFCSKVLKCAHCIIGRPWSGMSGPEKLMHAWRSARWTWCQPESVLLGSSGPKSASARNHLLVSAGCVHEQPHAGDGARDLAVHLLILFHGGMHRSLLALCLQLHLQHRGF